MRSIFILVSLLVSSLAFATKARIQSLQGARFLTDSQYVLQNPAQIHRLGQYLTFELGGTGNTSTPKAEGGMIRDMFGGRAGIYLGDVNSGDFIPSLQTNAGFVIAENPITLIYGRDDWAASVEISQSKKGTAKTEESSLAVNFGIDRDRLEGWVNLQLISTAKKGDDTFTGAPSLELGGEYDLGEDRYVTGTLGIGNAKATVSGTDTKTDVQGLSVTYLDRSLKKGKLSVYYGPGLAYVKATVGGKEVSTTQMPLYMGAQYQVKDWLEARASLSQNFFLLSSTKDETTANGTDSIANNTTVAVGFGAQFEDIFIDATFAGATTGQFNGNSILANLGAVIYF